MLNFLKNLLSARASRALSILILLIIIAAVPLTVFIAQKQQEIRQRAAVAPPTPTPVCKPRPPCLDVLPHPCELPEPIEGWCPTPAGEYGDNVLDIRDYNAFLSCFDERINTAPCLNKDAADLNDDGKVDSSDFLLLFESFQTQYGD